MFRISAKALLVLAALAASLLLVPASPADAADAPAAEDKSHAGYQFVYVTGYSTQTYGPSQYFPPKPFGGSVTYSRTFSVSNTWSATIGISPGVVSAGVGFQVDQTHTVSFSEMFNQPPRKPLTVTPTFGWEVTKYDIYRNGRKVGRVTVNRLVRSFLIAR